jgi:hypothetical protein
MSYNPATDFLGLLRLTAGGVRSERMPGLDYIIAALARAGFFSLSVGQVAPTVNQATTAWLKPALPSWVAEGTFYLWNSVTTEYEVATPTLWTEFLAGIVAPYDFQSMVDPINTVNPGVTLAAVQRNNPATTSVILPPLGAQFSIYSNRLQIVDFSTNVANHAIALTTPDGATIMQKNSWTLLSTADQLASIVLRPSPNLNSWVIG